MTRSIPVKRDPATCGYRWLIGDVPKAAGEVGPYA
jgi:hypothetical protein